MIEALPHRVLIVGAGPAGLAVAACLRELGVRATLLESGGAPGWSWSERYDSLRLHTTRHESSLPRLGMGAGPRYPTAAEYAAYCRHYARAFALDARLGVEVLALRRQAGLWCVETPRGVERAAVAVVATGGHRLPHRPPIPGEESFAGEILHSCDYRNGERFRGRRVLVVGAGNTAMDLAADLLAHGARPALAVRGPIHWMRRRLGPFGWHRRLRLGLLAPLALWRRLPATLGAPLARWTGAAAAAAARRRFGDLAGRGLPLADGEEILRRLAEERPPTVDSGIAALLRRGEIPVHRELVGLAPDAALCAAPPSAAGSPSPRRVEIDALILATGYRAGRDALLAAGTATDENLFVAGKAPLLSSIRREAPTLARRIAGVLDR